MSISLIQLRAGWRIASAFVLAAAAGTAGGSAFAQQATPVYDVQSGDTFSSIAARHTGNAGGWRKLYRADLTGLPNPNRLLVGMRLELATDAAGEPYLRVVGAAPGAPSRSASAQPNPAPATATGAATGARTASPPPSGSLTATPPVPAVPGTGSPLVIGVLPNIAGATLMTQYQRLARYLERTAGQKVTVVVPRNFKDFFDETMRGDYDIAIAAPHFARVAQADRGMVPLVTYQPLIHGLFVASADSTVAGPRDVRERVVAFANPQSLVAMYGQQWLRQAGLESGADYETRPARTDLGVGRMVLSGDAVAAIMSNGEFRALPSDESSRMKVVEIFARIPNFIFMAHPRIDAARLTRLKSLLLGFPADSEDGAPFVQATGFTGIVDVDPATMRELEAFAPATRRAMGVAPR